MYKTRILIQPDCGNSPRKGFLKDFNVALATGNIDYIDKVIQDKIEWKIIGQFEIHGKKDYLIHLYKHCLWNVKSLTIDTIITHGPDACVSGTVAG